MCKNDYSWSPNIYILVNGKYLKSIVDDPEIIYVVDIASTNKVNTSQQMCHQILMVKK